MLHFLETQLRFSLLRLKQLLANEHQPWFKVTIEVETLHNQCRLGRADRRVPCREPQELHLPLRPRGHDHLHVPQEQILIQGIYL